MTFEPNASYAPTKPKPMDERHAAVRVLLRAIGEDPDREGLADTPRRFVDALLEMTAGYREDAAAHLKVSFGDHGGYDEMIVVRAIPFTSLCEHHMMPFVGSVTVGYVPAEKVVGLSKIARAVQVFARRLQVQERLTAQIANAIESATNAKGVGVVVRATHACMASRGVRSPGEMVTSALRGVLLTRPEARSELLALDR